MKEQELQKKIQKVSDQTLEKSRTKILTNLGDKPNPLLMDTGELVYNQPDDILYTIDKNQELAIINERGSWMALGGPTAYVSSSVSAWGNCNSNGGMFKQLPNGIEILVTGQYRIVYYQRSALNDTSVYGTVSINGLRSNAETNPNGIFYHDHAYQSSTSVFSSYIGLLKAGDWVSGGASAAAQLMYGTQDYIGNLTITRL